MLWCAFTPPEGFRHIAICTRLLAFLTILLFTELIMRQISNPVYFLKPMCIHPMASSNDEGLPSLLVRKTKLWKLTYMQVYHTTSKISIVHRDTLRLTLFFYISITGFILLLSCLSVLFSLPRAVQAADLSNASF